MFEDLLASYNLTTPSKEFSKRKDNYQNYLDISDTDNPLIDDEDNPVSQFKSYFKTNGSSTKDDDTTDELISDLEDVVEKAKDTQKKTKIKTSYSPGARSWLSAYSKVSDPDANRYKNVLFRLSSIESSYNPRANNGNKAFGYTQMYESGSTHNVSHYAGTSTRDFLNNPVLQLSSSVKLMRDNDKHLTSSVIARGRAKGLSVDDMRAIMWFSGSGGLDAYLNGQDRNDGKTKVSQYLTRFRNVKSLRQ